MTPEKIQLLEELFLDTKMLFCVLFQSIKYLEYEQCSNSEQVFLCNIIEKKLNKISNLF